MLGGIGRPRATERELEISCHLWTLIASILLLASTVGRPPKWVPGHHEPRGGDLEEFFHYSDHFCPTAGRDLKWVPGHHESHWVGLGGPGQQRRKGSHATSGLFSPTFAPGQHCRWVPQGGCQSTMNHLAYLERVSRHLRPLVPLANTAGRAPK